MTASGGRGRHLQVVGLTQSADQEALIGAAGDESRPRIAPMNQRLPAIDPEVVVYLGCAVTLAAIGDQDRADPRLKESLAIVGRPMGIGAAGGDR
jgi:hypothetical protein